MPYYVFAIQPLGILQKRGEHASYREASAQAKALRAEQGDDTRAPRIKLMFGENQLAAEDALQQVRQAGPSGDE